MKKSPASYRLSDDARQLMKLLAQRLGVNETAVLELSVRDMAEKKGVSIKPSENINTCSASNVVQYS